MSSTTTSPPTYASLLTALLPPQTPAPVLPPASPNARHPQLTSSIAALQLHPTLESLLHILNGDLTSAHFLVRHMQAPPKWEGMLLHALLHRVEGDYDNARAWYGDVAESPVFEAVWGSKEAATSLVDDIEALRKKGQGKDRVEELKARSEREVRGLLGWCEKHFGTEAWADATSEWKPHSEKTKKIAMEQTMGGEGWRQF